MTILAREKEEILKEILKEIFKKFQTRAGGARGENLHVNWKAETVPVLTRIPLMYFLKDFEFSSSGDFYFTVVPSDQISPGSRTNGAVGQSKV